LLRRSIAAGASFEAQYRLGVALNQQKQFAEALLTLREAFALTQPDQLVDRAHVLFRRAEAAEGLGRMLDAKRLLEMSLTFEEHPKVRAKLGALEDGLASGLIEAGDIREALEQATKDFDIQRTAGQEPKIDVWVNFALGQAGMTAGGRAQAEQLAEALQSPFLAKWRYRIVGHTDRTGTDAINDPLSVRRAGTVREFLVGKGMRARRLSAEGKGSREPLRPGSSAGDYAVNRRVQVVLVREE